MTRQKVAACFPESKGSCYLFGIALLIAAAAQAAPRTTTRSPLPDPELAAALDSPSIDSISTANPTATLSSSYRPTAQERRMSVLLPSVVVHGFAIDKEVANQMPRKLDNGQTVVTPGVGLQYTSPGGFLVIGGVLKDCYDNLAGLLQLGQQFHLASHTTFGYSLGFYARETPMACQTTVNRFGRSTTSCDEFDSYQLKWLTRVNGESVDIIPMPFLHLTTALYRDETTEIDFKIMSNFALNEFGFSIPF